MAVVARCDLETAKAMRNKGISTRVDNKNHKVYLVTECDDSNVEEVVQALKSGVSVIGIEYIGSSLNMNYLSLNEDVVGSLYIYKKELFGSNVTEEDIKRFYEETPSGVVPVVSLPEDFTDLKSLVDFTSKYPRLRFCGDGLIEVCNLRLGCYGRDIFEKRGIKIGSDTLETFDGGNGLKTVMYNDLNCDITDKPEKTIRTSSNSSNSVSAGRKKQLLFSSLLNSGTKAEL